MPAKEKRTQTDFNLLHVVRQTQRRGLRQHPIQLDSFPPLAPYPGDHHPDPFTSSAMYFAISPALIREVKSLRDDDQEGYLFFFH